MRICILSEFFYPDKTGGTGPVVSTLARNFADNQGAEVDVITSRSSYRNKNQVLGAAENWDGVQISRVSTPDLNVSGTLLRTLGNLIFALKVTLRLLFGRTYDAVFVTTAPPFLPIAADVYRFFRKVPYVYIVYDLEPDRVVGLRVLDAKSPIVRAMRRLQRRWLGRASKVVPIGRCMAEILNKTYGLSYDRMSVIAVGSDDVAGAYGATDRSSNESAVGRSGDVVTEAQIANDMSYEHGVRAVADVLAGKSLALRDAKRGGRRADCEETSASEDKGIATGRPFTITYSGNFGRYHDFDPILDAAKRLQEENVPVKFVLAGQGVRKRDVAARVQSEGISSVELRDFAPIGEYASVLAASDACLVTMEAGLDGTCVPSKFYSIMSAGRPTLALVSERSEVAKTIEEFGCGLRVDQTDSQALVDAIKLLSSDPALVSDMGQRARSAYEQRFTSENSAALIYSVISNAARVPRSTRELETARK